jgi:hypothetical protein
MAGNNFSWLEVNAGLAAKASSNVSKGKKHAPDKIRLEMARVCSRVVILQMKTNNASCGLNLGAIKTGFPRQIWRRSVQLGRLLAMAFPGVACRAQTPAILPDGGSCFSRANVALQSPDTNATIFYTLDGSLPTTHSLPYSGAFNLASNVTISEFAAETNFNNRIAVSALFLVQPLYFTSDSFLTNRQLQLGFSGATGSNNVLPAATNLTTWTPISTNTAVTNLFNFFDPKATNFPSRYYRVLQQ